MDPKMHCLLVVQRMVEAESRPVENFHFGHKVVLDEYFINGPGIRNIRIVLHLSSGGVDGK